MHLQLPPCWPPKMSDGKRQEVTKTRFHLPSIHFPTSTTCWTISPNDTDIYTINDDINHFPTDVMTNEPPTKRFHTETDHQSSQLASYKGSPLELKCINTIRALAADMVQRANSGHPGAPMGCAPMAHLLWSSSSCGGVGRHHSATNPKWWNRDRFVLSNGHACALQYVMLHLSGYEDCAMDQLKAFRQVGSRTPGHPENFCTKGE